MIDLAKLIRTDRGLSVNEALIREEVKRIIELEAEIANVSTLDTLDFWHKSTPSFFLIFCRRVFYQSLVQEDYLCKRFIREPALPVGEQLLCKTSTSPPRSPGFPLCHSARSFLSLFLPDRWIYKVTAIQILTFTDRKPPGI